MSLLNDKNKLDPQPTVPMLLSSHYHPMITVHIIVMLLLPSSMLLKYTNNKHENIIIPQQKIITKQCMCFFCHE